MMYTIIRYTQEESSMRARCLIHGPVSIMFRKHKDGLWYCSDTFIPLSATIKASLVMLRIKR